MNWNRFLVVVSIASLACANPQAQEADAQKVDTQKVETQKVDVDAAFSAARGGDSSAVTALAEQGPRIIPEVKPYLDDSDESVRSEAVALLGAIEGGEGCQALLGALTDASQDIRERAARTLYSHCDPAALAQAEGAEAALVRSVELGSSAAGAALLLGYCQSAEAKAALDAVAQNKKALKLEPWTQPVPASLAAAVALSHRNDPAGSKQLLQAVSNGALPEQVFLLQVIRDINDTSVLTALSKHLSDEREISGGVPSGATPRPRLSDLALNTFAEKLKLDLGFELSTSRRYSSDELEKARQAVSQALASR